MNWFRISIRETLLIVTIVAMAVVLFSTNRQLSRLRPELKRLRNEVGFLDVQDTSKFHVIQVPTDSIYHWRWRVFLPAGHDCSLCCYFGEVPKTGYRSPKFVFQQMGVGSKSEREFFLDLNILNENYRGKCSINASYGNQSYVLLEYDDGPPLWHQGKIMYEDEVAGHEQAESFDADAGAYLLRLRSDTRNNQSNGDGILAWLTVEKQVSPRLPKSQGNNNIQ